METCLKILQLKFDQKLTNRCIRLTMKISASTVFEIIARFKATSLPWPLSDTVSHDDLEKRIFPPNRNVISRWQAIINWGRGYETIGTAKP